MKAEDLLSEYLIQCVKQGTGAKRVKPYGSYTDGDKTVFSIAVGGFEITNDSIWNVLKKFDEDRFYKTLAYHSFSLSSESFTSETIFRYQIDNSELYGG